MPVATRQRREYSNVRVYFIPSGDTIDDTVDVMVSKSSWPDATPTTNWTNYQIRDIERCVPIQEIESEPFKIPADSGGYDIDTEEMVIRRIWEFTTSISSSLFKRFEHALGSIVEPDVAQSPGTKNDNFLLGVMLAEFQNKDGSIIERWQLWGKLRLKEIPPIEPKTRSWVFTFEQSSSLLNTYVLK